MTGTRKSARFDRRRAARRKQRVPALVGPKRAAAEQCENALIQELAADGARIVSGAPLKEEDSLVLYVGDEQKPVRAKVVWVRKEGMIEKRRSGKPGQAFLAGCRLRAAAAKPAEKKRAVPTVDLASHVMRGAFIAGALGLAGLVIYAIVSLGNMMG